MGEQRDAERLWNLLSKFLEQDPYARAPDDQEAQAARVHTILALIEHMPRGSGVVTVHDAERALADFIDYWDFSEDEEEAARAFAAFFEPRDFVVAFPVALSDYEVEETKVGGRRYLHFIADRRSEPPECILRAVIAESVGHWYPMVRLAEETHAEIIGLLAAHGLIRYDSGALRRAWSRLGERDNLGKVRWSDNRTPEPMTGELIAWGWSDRVSRATFVFPENLSELEIAKLRSTRDDAGLVRTRLQHAMRAMAGSGEHWRRVRRAARFTGRAFAAENPAESFLHIATALEGLLLEGSTDALGTRVGEAAALLLARTPTERSRIKKLTKKMYDVRSKYIHEGDYHGIESERLESLDICARVLRAEAALVQAEAPVE